MVVDAVVLEVVDGNHGIKLEKEKGEDFSKGNVVPLLEMLAV